MSIEGSRERGMVKRSARVNGIAIDVDRLIASSEKFAAEKVSLERFTDFRLHDRGWNTSSGENIGPKQVIDLAAECGADYARMIEREPTWKEHIERVRQADVDVPLLVTDEFGLIDGAHRITKVFIENGENVVIRVVPNDQINDYRL